MVDLKGSEHGPVGAGPAPDQTATPLEEVDALATGKSSKSPAFQIYPKDFLSSSKVRKMSLTEIGAYIVLLLTSWLDGSLPNDPSEIARTLGIKEAQFKRMWTGPLGQCFAEKNGRLFNERLECERKSQAEFRKKQKDKADARWHPSGNAAALPRTNKRHASGNALHLQSASASAKEEEISAEPQSDSPPVLTFPTVGKRKTWVLTETDVAHWRELYPALDIAAECRRALAWVEANSPKTAKGMPAFLVRWFNQATDRGVAKFPAAKQQQTSEERLWEHNRRKYAGTNGTPA
mgnify:FL=1